MNRRHFFSALAGFAVASKLPVKPQKITVSVAHSFSVAPTLDETVFRDLAITDITPVLETGIRGVKEKWLRVTLRADVDKFSADVRKIQGNTRSL